MTRGPIPGIMYAPPRPRASVGPALLGGAIAVVALAGVFYGITRLMPMSFTAFPWWVGAIAFGVGGGIVVALGMASLSGLGSARKWTAIVVRLLVLLLLILILGGIRWSRQHKDVEVIILQDVSLSTDNITNYPRKNTRGDREFATLGKALEDYFRNLAADPTKQKDDRIGLISFQEFARVEAMPNKELRLDTRGLGTRGTGTDVASSIMLGLATKSPDAMTRFVLVSDGNANLGDIDSAIAAAAAAGVPIDIVPLSYNVQNDVMIERFTAPSWRRENEPFSLTITLNSTNAQNVTGKLRVEHLTSGRSTTQPGELLSPDLDMDPSTPGVQRYRQITIKPGKHSEVVQVPAMEGGGVHRFKAYFEPDVPGAGVTVGSTTGGRRSINALEDNDSAEGFTFVRGKRKLLFVDGTALPGREGKGQRLREAMEEQQILFETRAIDDFPRNLVELQNYDAVILYNVSRGGVTDQGVLAGINDDQDAILRSYVHDTGGGLLMIGGEQSFGAGGWQNSKVKDILPVDMEIPAQRHVGKGALVLIMHSCEMPQGNYWGEQCAIQAVKTLSALDDVGIISYGWNNANQGIGGAQWDFPLQQKNDGATVMAAIKKMQLGDMPSFDDSMNLAINGAGGTKGLKDSNARHKHIIIISDGDPAAPAANLMAQCRASKISVSTVTVFPHMPGQARPPVMDDMPKAAAPGGKAYGPIENNPGQLPRIFTKEATIVRRSLIHEDAGGMAITLSDRSSDMVQNIPDPPPVIHGMVLTSRKNDPKVEVPMTVGKMKDPLLARWQTGLGRAAVWTSDAHDKWASAWASNAAYSKFFQQIISSISAQKLRDEGGLADMNNFDVTVKMDGNKGTITVKALGDNGDGMSFLNVAGTVVGGRDFDKPQSIRLTAIGPGVYQGTFEAGDPGSYVAALRYTGRGGPDGGEQQGTLLAGAVQNRNPEQLNLSSDEATLERIRQGTGGRRLEAFQPAGSDVFIRDGLRRAASPKPIWEVLIPILLALIILDVAVRRIAWDWVSIKRMFLGMANRVRMYTASRKVESKPVLDALKRVREEVAEQKFRQMEQAGGAATPPPLPGRTAAGAPRPDPKAKFVPTGAVEGDITQVVGGATNKPVPPPKKTEPKGGEAAGGHLGGLMAAKKRAQQEIREKQQGDNK